MGVKEHLERFREGPESWNRWRASAPLIKPDLSDSLFSDIDFRNGNLSDCRLDRAIFDGTDLRGANLTSASLTLASFSNVDLTGGLLPGVSAYGANFVGSNLTETDLSRGNFMQANFTTAKLERANFQEALLLWANFAGAYLAETNFSSSMMLGTGLGLTDLSSTRGLAKVNHLGPSSVSADTLIASGGKIPERFLRLAGVPEVLITVAMSAAAHTPDYHSCFISYSHADQGFARRLYNVLQEHRIQRWLDEKQMLPGDDIYDQVQHGIRMWDRLLLCCSETALNSWWVNNEIDTAFQKERDLMRGRGKRVLVLTPLDLDGYLIDGKWHDGKARAVLSRFVADFRGWAGNNERFNEAAKQVIRSLRADKGARQAHPQQSSEPISA